MALGAFVHAMSDKDFDFLADFVVLDLLLEIYRDEMDSEGSGVTPFLEALIAAAQRVDIIPFSRLEKGSKRFMAALWTLYDRAFDNGDDAMMRVFERLKGAKGLHDFVSYREAKRNVEEHARSLPLDVRNSLASTDAAQASIREGLGEDTIPFAHWLKMYASGCITEVLGKGRAGKLNRKYNDREKELLWRAQGMLERSWSIYERSYKNHTDVEKILLDLSVVYLELNHLRSARRVQERLLAFVEHIHGTDHFRVCATNAW